jgi:hypothetical protein
MPSVFKVKSGYVLYVPIVVNSSNYKIQLLTQVKNILDFQSDIRTHYFPIIKQADKAIPNSAK